MLWRHFLCWISFLSGDYSLGQVDINIASTQFNHEMLHETWKRPRDSIQSPASLKGASPCTHAAHSRRLITSEVWATREKAQHHAWVCLLSTLHKYVSGVYFVPSTECDSGKGHTHKEGHRVCTWEKAEPALQWGVLLTCVSCLIRLWFWDSSWASFLSSSVHSPGLHMLFHVGSFLIQILPGWLILLFGVPS